MDAAGVAQLLREQGKDAASHLPSSVLAALSGPSAGPPAERRAPASPVAAAAPYGAVAAPAWRLFPPVVLLVAVGVLAGVLARRAHRPGTFQGDPFGAGLSHQPAAPAPPPAPGDIGYDLAAFLDSPGGDVPQRFVFDHLAFERGSARITPESLPTLSRVAAALRAHPNAEVALEGHTDATGSPADNRRLSLARANAIKAALVTRGVAADRITTAGMGQDQPIASNDTEEGRARNRRTELVVTSR